MISRASKFLRLRLVPAMARVAVCCAVLIFASCSKPDPSPHLPNNSGDNQGGNGNGNGNGGNGNNGNGNGKPDPVTGNYRVEVGGYFFGPGSATVTGNSIHITAEVKNEAGVKGTFTATVTVAGGHFKGSGSVMGHSLKMIGRLDPSDFKGNKKSRVLRSPRIVCTFEVDDGHHGRVVGERGG